MRDAAAVQTVHANEYLPPAFLVESVFLDFTLDAHQTRVDSRMQMVRNADRDGSPQDLWLDGEHLELLRVAIDGNTLDASRYEQTARGLWVRNVPDAFVLEISVHNDPQNNTALEGLYLSHGMLCTQCEAQGFRRITFYPDRPDVLSIFTTRIRGDKQKYPLLLSNGNPTELGEDDTTHWVTWNDPFPKPCYLFALVAGELGKIEDTFTTMSGREVTLRIYAEEHDLDKLDHAMASLKNAMRWDEEAFGREYDLDLFMIVAVSHFNMGAMENKGLNVFNTSCVLAHPKTTTDAGFQRVESVVAHEYFHNWSGDRVTCRDWFQLSLKEGFTVHREHEFAADMNSRAVKRVQDASFLRSVQFAEDRGPMAHPVRPASYQKIDNFYTVTIYEKGAEVVRMQKELLGPQAFRAATDDYFETYDGQAVTCDDFVSRIEAAGNVDLTQFKRWYSQAGTPNLSVRGTYEDGTYTLHFEQHTAPTPGQDHKEPFVIPIACALVGENGPLALNDAGDTETLIVLDKNTDTVSFAVDEKPVPSLLRRFSAPVELSFDYSEDDLQRLLRRDTDGYCRWDAAQRLYFPAVERLIADPAALDDEVARLVPTFRDLLRGAEEDPAQTALLLALPSESLIGDRQSVWQPQAVHTAREALKRGLAEALSDALWIQADANATPGPYAPTAEDIAKRSLRWTALAILATLQDERIGARLAAIFEHADNMTDELNALRLLTHYTLPGAGDALASFAKKWADEALVMDKWFSLQATRPSADALEDVRALLKHPQFTLSNPNRARSVIGGFAAGNPVAFHQKSGAGYALFFEQLQSLDARNPQVAARLATVTTRLARLPRDRQTLLRDEIQRVIAQGCSENVAEVFGRVLAG